MNDRRAVKKITKSPFLAGILSAIFPGTGALYNGDYWRGVIFIIIFAGLITMQTRSGTQPFAGLILAGFYIFQIIDAIHGARMINLVAEGGSPTTVEPTLGQKAEAPGSVFWGIFLIALGIIFLLANFDIILYERIFDFWPLFIIVIGLKLIVDALTRHK
ncbi:MAG: LiaI-LiaF-like domain-containing protein [Candidatus Aminicenantales bacterium]